MLLYLLVVFSLQIATCSAACDGGLHPLTPRKYYDRNNVEHTCPLGYIYSTTTCLCSLVDPCYGANQLPEGFRFQIPGSGLTCYTFIQCSRGDTIFSHCQTGYRFVFHEGCIHSENCVYTLDTIQHSSVLDIYFPPGANLVPIIERHDDVDPNNIHAPYPNREPHIPGGGYNAGPCQYQNEGYIYHPEDGACYEYNVCRNQYPIPARCPYGYSYNPDMGCMYDYSCLYEEDYNITASRCLNQPNCQMFPYGGYCSEYTICYNGFSYYGRCPNYYSYKQGEGCVADRNCITYHNDRGICTPDMEGAAFTYHEYCYEYYVCYSGMAHYQRCPDGFSFSQGEGCIEDLYCTYEQHLQKEKDPCYSLKDGAKYTAGGFCNEYYMCRHTKSIYQRCPNGYAYKDQNCVEDHYCKYRKPGDFDTHHYYRQKRDLADFPDGYMDFCYERPNGYIYNVGGFCYEYYRCHERFSYYTTCPDGFSFRYPDGCVVDEYCRQYPVDSGPFDFCDGKSDNFTYTMGGYCNEYFQCKHDCSIFQKCPETYRYSQDHGCIYDATCTTTVPGHYSEDGCKNLVNGQGYRNGGHCYEFYECWNQTSYYETCPSGFKYDGHACVHDKDCYYEHHFKSDFCVDAPDGYCYSGGYCYEFYQCYNGMAFYKRCPESYVFDAASGDCVHSYDCIYNHHKQKDFCYDLPDGFTYEQNGHCYEYYICHYGKSFYQRCPIGYSYRYGKGCVYDGECYYFHFYYQYYFYFYYYYYGGDAKANDVLHVLDDGYVNAHTYPPIAYGTTEHTYAPEFAKRDADGGDPHIIKKRQGYPKHDICAHSPDGHTYNLGGHCYEYFTCSYAMSFYSRCPNMHRYEEGSHCVYDPYCQQNHLHADMICKDAPDFYTFSYGGHCFEYYYCFHGFAKYERCPWGHAFHQHSGCIPDEHCSFTLMLPFDNCEHHPDGYKYTDGGHCYEYHQCYHGKSYYERCPDGHKFNGETCIYDKTCTYIASCRYYGTSKNAYKDFCETKDDGFKYSFGTYCYDYYLCSEKQSWYQRCPDGQGFNGTGCNFDENCFYHQHIMDSNIQSDLCYHKPDGYTYSKAGFCYEYYVCDGTQSYYERCPDGHRYEPSKGCCIEDADCLHHSMVSKTVNLCELYKEGETFSRKGNCYEYYICSGKKALYQRCPNKYRYEYGAGCVKAEHCLHRTPILEHCRYKKDGFRYSVMEFCYEYYECFGGNSYYYQCPYAMRFDTKDNKCVRDTECKDHHYVGKDFCWDKPDYSRYTYGTHCFDFFECNHGYTYYERCPAGFAFDGSGCVEDFQCYHYEGMIVPFANTKDICSGQPEFSAYKKHDFCYDYYLCIGGISHYERCPYGFAFLDGHGCSFDEYCYYHVHHHNSGHNDQCSFQENHKTFRTSGYCWEYEVCYNGKAYTQRCPIGQAFKGGHCTPDYECFHQYLIHYSIHYHGLVKRSTDFLEIADGTNITSTVQEFQQNADDTNMTSMVQEVQQNGTELERVKRIAGGAPPPKNSNLLLAVNTNYCYGKPQGYTYSIGGYCYEYYRCYNGKAYYMTCPYGFGYKYGEGCVYDGYCFHCDLLGYDYCKNEPSGETYSTGGYCGDYFICKHYNSIYERCPNYYRYDGKKCVVDERCHFYMPIYAHHDCEKQYDGFRFKYQGYCYEYYECANNGTAYYQVCPYGYSFNGESCIIDPKCYYQRSVNDVDYCNGKPDGSIYGKGGFCDEHYTCSNGSSVFARCPRGFGFHGYQGCVQDYSCINRRGPPLSEPCLYLGEGSTYTLGEPCYEFYVCRAWKSVLQKCPSGYSYNYHAQNCVKDYTCKQTRVKRMCHSSSNGYMYPADNCYGYYLCTDGKPFYKQCAKGYKFESGSCRYDITRTCQRLA